MKEKKLGLAAVLGSAGLAIAAALSGCEEEKAGVAAITPGGPPSTETPPATRTIEATPTQIATATQIVETPPTSPTIQPPTEISTVVPATQPRPEFTATLEPTKYQEAIDLLDQVKNFFTPDPDECLSQFGIDKESGEIGSYKYRKDQMLPAIDEIKTNINEGKLEDADLLMRRFFGSLAAPLQTTTGGQDQMRVDPSQYLALDPKRHFFAPGDQPTYPYTASQCLWPALENFVQAWYKLENESQ